MNTLHNVLRIVLVDPPKEFDGMNDVVAMLESRCGPEPGESDTNGNVTFETRYTSDPDVRGPALKKEKDGRPFIYLGWYGTKAGVRTRFRASRSICTRCRIWHGTANWS